jgi:hypothetical protein
MTYRRVEPVEGATAQYLAVHVLRWHRVAHGEPTDAFIEDNALDALLCLWREGYRLALVKDAVSERFVVAARREGKLTLRGSGATSDEALEHLYAAWERALMAEDDDGRD